MINFQSNTSEIVRLALDKLQQIENPDQLLRSVAFGVLPELKKRVHVEGKATDGAPIGTYSKSYMTLRTGTYKNADIYKKGVKKGEKKNSGKSLATGQARPKYNRSADPKVILSLTRQMENDLAVSPTPSGYGIGFKNEFNYQKSQWNELTYNKKIWALTIPEHELAIKIAEAFIEQHFN